MHIFSLSLRIFLSLSLSLPFFIYFLIRKGHPSRFQSRGTSDGIFSQFFRAKEVASELWLGCSPLWSPGAEQIVAILD